ncbi:MAG: 3-carboxy-cis,cis-muconate cycloisomerase, partial [Catenulispora sp.]|nr:3-carboxy-cis,cis-muconate cycloisomerase [Catenulispora sp.]
SAWSEPDSASSELPDFGAVEAGVVSVASPTDSALALVGRFARTLGLAEPLLPWHTLRTPIADIASTLALASGALGKIAADVLILGRPETGEVSESLDSSTMPHTSHTANPVRAVLIAGAARQVPALASILFASVAADDERPAGAWHAEWQPLREALRLVGGAAATTAELLGGLRVCPERMAENLAGLDLAAAREFTGRAVTDPRDYLGAASALVDRALKPNQ